MIQILPVYPKYGWKSAWKTIIIWFFRQSFQLHLNTYLCCWQSLFWIILHESINKSNLFLCREARKNLFPFFSFAIWKPVVVFPAFDVWSFRFVFENKREKCRKKTVRRALSSKAIYVVKMLECLLDIPLLGLTHKQSKETSFNYHSFPVDSFNTCKLTQPLWIAIKFLVPYFIIIG